MRHPKPSRPRFSKIRRLYCRFVITSHHTSDHVDDYLEQGINIAITVCDNANEACPTFPLNVERIHWSIDDPFRGWNFDTNQMDTFRETRTKIQGKILEFLKSH